MAEITSDSVADFIPESMADFARNTHYILKLDRRRLRVL
jgi:hypothetical protein